eukprot:994862-Rhodomonas_salina.1
MTTTDTLRERIAGRLFSQGLSRTAGQLNSLSLSMVDTESDDYDTQASTCWQMQTRMPVCEGCVYNLKVGATSGGMSREEGKAKVGLHQQRQAQ